MASAPILHNPCTVEGILELMRSKLDGIVPDVELQLKAELAAEINRLKAEKNAVILGHNYMEPALFCSVPDFTGDSLQLSRASADTDADIILFCGVLFMAETAKVLGPDKMVLIPTEKAGCSLAEGVCADDVLALKERFPGAPVVTYVNTYAETKAVSDYCCTSGNATAVARHLLEEGHKKIIFLPDEFLARNTARELGIGFVEGWNEDAVADESSHQLIGWKARCEVHELFTPEDVDTVRRQYPEAVIIAHPECPPEVIEKCDVSGSTKVMVDYVRDSDAKQFMLMTECSMGDNLAVENPGKEMVRLCSHQCPHMALITLEDTLACLRNEDYQVELPKAVIEAARTPIDRMLSIM